MPAPGLTLAEGLGALGAGFVQGLKEQRAQERADAQAKSEIDTRAGSLALEKQKADATAIIAANEAAQTELVRKGQETRNKLAAQGEIEKSKATAEKAKNDAEVNKVKLQALKNEAKKAEIEGDLQKSNTIINAMRTINEIYNSGLPDEQKTKNSAVVYERLRNLGVELKTPDFKETRYDVYTGKPTPAYQKALDDEAAKNKVKEPLQGGVFEKRRQEAAANNESKFSADASGVMDVFHNARKAIGNAGSDISEGVYDYFRAPDARQNDLDKEFNNYVDTKFNPEEKKAFSLAKTDDEKWDVLKAHKNRYKQETGGDDTHGTGYDVKLKYEPLIDAKLDEYQKRAGFKIGSRKVLNPK